MTDPLRDTIRTKLERILDDSLECMQVLHGALVEERAALESGDTVALGSATAAKAAPVARLAGLDIERAAATREAGFGGEASRMPSVIEWCDTDASLSSSWRRLLDLTRECDQHNSTNGAIVSLRRHQVASGLGILRGEAPAETYGASGAAATSAGRRALTKA